jgi:hypothetical protein
MKKVFLILVAAMVGLSAMAQIDVAAKVAGDLTHFIGKDVEHGMQPNYQAGFVAEYKFNDKFGIAPEVVYAAQGGKCDHIMAVRPEPRAEILVPVDADVTYNTNYINVPVMLKYYVSPNFAIDFGPQIGFNVYSKVKVENIDDAIDLKDNTKAVDFGVGLGGTYYLTDRAFLQARYTMGLSGMFDKEERVNEIFNIDNAKNGNIQVAFGWKFK